MQLVRTVRLPNENADSGGHQLLRRADSLEVVATHFAQLGAGLFRVGGCRGPRRLFLEKRFDLGKTRLPGVAFDADHVDQPPERAYHA